MSRVTHCVCSRAGCGDGSSCSIVSSDYSITSLDPPLFKFDRLILPAVVKRRSPNFVRSLMFGAAKTE